MELPTKTRRTSFREAVYWTALFASSVSSVIVAVTFAQTAQESGAKAATKAPAQPVPFSHKVHVGLELPCKFCHENAEPGSLMGFPSTDKCMACHASVAKDRPSIRILAQFAKDNQPIPWVRIYSVPGFVYWSHRTHLDADIKCVTCHNDVAHLEVLTVAVNVTTMGGCVDCHKRNAATTGCAACHENHSSQSQPVNQIWFMTERFTHTSAK